MDASQSTSTPPEPASSDSLETPANDENALETPENPAVTDATSDKTLAGAASPSGAQKSGGLKQKLRKFNIYLLLFVLLIVVGGVIIGVAYLQSQKASVTSTLKTQSLTQTTLNQVASSDSTIGSSSQVLNVESSAVFAGKVLVRDDLEVAGSLQIGGTVALTDLTVSGTSALGQVQVNQDLSVAGNAGIQGDVTIAKSLQVNSTGTFSGALSAPQITTSDFQLNADLVLTHHIVAGGANPGRSNGPALGSGGTASVSGSDTAGSVSINTGSSPAAGCFATINFTQAYDATPHVLITPIGSAAGGIAYYVDRNTAGFSICDATAPPAGSSFGFDYFVVD
jgi:cytoskeletal protein CcmA (bactofilin family)